MSRSKLPVLVPLPSPLCTVAKGSLLYLQAEKQAQWPPLAARLHRPSLPWHR